MNNWCSIDLHLHTMAGITRDKKRDVVNFSYTAFQRVIEKYNFGLMAVTNHNIINMENYILMRYLCKKNNTNILLGVELDSKLTMEADVHIATIFNSDNFLNNFEAMIEINNKTQEKREDNSHNEIVYTDEDIVDLLYKYDVILIPHGDKDRGFFRDAGKEQIDEALKKISEGFIRIFDNPSKWKMEQIKKHLDELTQDDLDEFGGVLFSDNRDWNIYDRKYKDFFMNAEPTFKGLLHAVTNPTKRFCKKDEIKFNSNYISRIEINTLNSNDKIKSCTLNLSPYYNCIIGKSGSGKSLLLHLIKRNLIRDFSDDDKYENFNNCSIKFYNERNQLLTPELINIGVGENLFDKIITASTTKDVNDLYRVAQLLKSSFKPRVKFDKFIEEYTNKINKYIQYKNQNRQEKESLIQSIVAFEGDIAKLMLLTDIKTFEISHIEANKFENTNNDIDKFAGYSEFIVRLLDISSIYKGKYQSILNEKINELNQYFNLSHLDMKNTYYNNYLKNKKIDIINSVINQINGSRSNQALEKNYILEGLPKKREKIIYLIKSIYLNSKIMKNFDFSFNSNELSSSQVISNDSSVEVKEFFDNDLFKKFDIKDNDIFKTYGFKSQLKHKKYDLTKKEDSLNVIDKYIEIGLIKFMNISFRDEFKPKVQVLFDKQDVIKLNPGDISKKYISIYFKERLRENNNSVILFDQIENDVDKPFINGTIRRIIEDTKGEMQMIIVTHDPIVAVNADPNRYIISNKDIDQTIEYRDFVIESTDNDEIKTISDVVDGSKKAIKRRYEIYKGENLDE